MKKCAVGRDGEEFYIKLRLYFFLTDVIQKFEQLPNLSAVQTYICKSFRICQVLIVFCFMPGVACVTAPGV